MARKLSFGPQNSCLDIESAAVGGQVGKIQKKFPIKKNKIKSGDPLGVVHIQGHAT